MKKKDKPFDVLSFVIFIFFMVYVMIIVPNDQTFRGYMKVQYEQIQTSIDQKCAEVLGEGNWHGYRTGNWIGTSYVCTNKDTNETKSW